jgi:hypothetical protein
MLHFKQEHIWFLDESIIQIDLLGCSAIKFRTSTAYRDALMWTSISFRFKGG